MESDIEIVLLVFKLKIHNCHHIFLYIILHPLSSFIMESDIKIVVQSTDHKIKGLN